MNGPESLNCIRSCPQVHKKETDEEFSTFKSQGTPTQPTLEPNKLVVKLSHRQLTPLEEEVLVLGLANCPQKYFFEDIIAAIWI